MSHCTGTPAEEKAEQYVAGTLSDPEAQAFEEHYFDCPACLAQLQALQAVAAEIRRNPVSLPGRVIRWPGVVGTIGAIAALLLITLVGYRQMAHRPNVAVNSGATPAPAPAPQPQSPLVKPAMLAEIADRALPVFQPALLRGEQEQTAFEQGMQAYAKGDCQSAQAMLRRVPAGDGSALAAQFYSGVCALHEGKLEAATASLTVVAHSRGAVLEESGLYYLAQVALEENNGSEAQRLLKQVAALRGDYEGRAQRQLDGLAAGDSGKE